MPCHGAAEIRRCPWSSVSLAGGAPARHGAAGERSASAPSTPRGPRSAPVARAAQARDQYPSSAAAAEALRPPPRSSARAPGRAPIRAKLRDLRRRERPCGAHDSSSSTVSTAPAAARRPGPRSPSPPRTRRTAGSRASPRAARRARTPPMRSSSAGSPARSRRAGGRARAPRGSGCSRRGHVLAQRTARNPRISAARRRGCRGRCRCRTGQARPRVSISSAEPPSEKIRRRSARSSGSERDGSSIRAPT